MFVDDLGYCGGTIISDDFVMTAAHCVADYSRWVIMAGAHDITADTEPGRIEITSYDAFPHPEWNPTKWYGDVGLIRLPEPLDFDDNPAIRPSCLPPSVEYLIFTIVKVTLELRHRSTDIDNSYVPGRATATGWGRTFDDQSGVTPILHYVSDLPVIDNAACAAWYDTLIYPGIMCIDR